MTDTAYNKLLSHFQDAVLNGQPDVGAELATPREGFDGPAQMAAYIQAYRLRLQGVVTKDYPALGRYLGAAHMQDLVMGYVAQTQSHGYNLNPYAIGFADYVRQKCDDAFARALAALESAILTVYLAPDSPALTQAWLQQQAPDHLLSTPLQPRTAFALLALEWNAEAYLKAHRQGVSATPEQKPIWLAICRHENQTQRHPLEAEEYILLKQLTDGVPLADAMEALHFAEDEAAQAAVTAKLQQWLQRWLANGFFQQPESA